MPELPEVETVVRELRINILNRQIDTVTAFWNRSLDERTDIPLHNQTVHSINRRGKYIILDLNQTCLIIHLRMTGQLLFFPTIAADIDKHVRVRMTFKDSSELHFKDTRKFGRFYHVFNPEEILQNVGIDALDEMMDSAAFRALLGKSKMNIKAYLLNQRYISGLGNIYVDESLFRSKLHPSTPARSLKDEQCAILYTNVQNVLTEAIANMGSTISDYRDTYGNSGNNQNFFQVYGRAGKHCLNCGSEIVKIRFAGRGTHFCPQCQKPFEGNR